MKQKITLSILLLASFVELGLSQDAFLPPVKMTNLSTNQSKYYGGAKIFSVDKFSLGVKGGANFSLIIPFNRSSIFSGQDPSNYQKDYNFPIENIGMQMGFILMYDLSRFIKISLQPSSNDYTYKYVNTYAWQGNTNLEYESEYAQKLRFFEIPLIVGLYMTYKTWQPYFQGGIYYGRLINGVTNISAIETSTNLAGSSQEITYSTSANSTNLYRKNQFGVLAGAGIAYLAGRTRIGLEANYKLLISNLNTIETRYMNNQVVSGNYDVPDKFKFSNISINLNIIVPLFCQNSNSRGAAIFCE